MATYYEVLHYLSSDKEFYSAGTTYEDIIWKDETPGFTKQEFLAAFETVDQIKNEKNQLVVSAIAKLEALGLTEDEAKAIVGI